MATISTNMEEVFQDLGYDFGQVEDALEDRELIKSLANEALDGIQKRTLQGKDARLGDLKKPYSKAHAKKRKEKGLQTGHVDLAFSGLMMAGMDFRVKSDTEAELYVKGQRGIVASAHHLGVPGKLPRRPWFDLDPKQEEHLEEMALEWLARVVRHHVVDGRRGAVGAL